MDQTLSLLFQHADKGLSAILLIFFIVRLLPQITKLNNTIAALKESSDRRERQSDDTQKELIKLTERLKVRQEKQ